MLKIVLLVVLLVSAWLGLSSLERRSLYFPDRQVFATPQVYRLAYEDLMLRDSDGTRIHGWFIPKAGRPAPGLTLLFCHGNAGNISHRLDKVLKFHQIGLNVLLFDYRGYGQSEGRPSEAGTYLDAEAAYHYLTRTKKIPPARIVLYGESLGCAVAVEMAHRHPAAALILESPFTSTAAMGKRVYPWLPVRWMVRNKYDNLSKIPRIRLPLLILHSPRDEIVPFQMGRQLFAAAPGPKKFFELTGGHNDGYEMTGAAYIQTIDSFLKGVGDHG